MPSVEELQVDDSTGTLPPEGVVREDHLASAPLEKRGLLNDAPFGVRCEKVVSEEGHLLGKHSGELVIWAFETGILVEFQLEEPSLPENLRIQSPPWHCADGGEERSQREAVAPSRVQHCGRSVDRHLQPAERAVAVLARFLRGGIDFREELEESEILAEASQLRRVPCADLDLHLPGGEKQRLDLREVVAFQEPPRVNVVEFQQPVVFRQVAVEISNKRVFGQHFPGAFFPVAELRQRVVAPQQLRGCVENLLPQGLEVEL